MTRLALLLAWMAGFAALNYLARTLAVGLPPGGGIRSLISLLVSSYMLYAAAFLYLFCAILYFAALRIMPLSTAGPVFLVAGTAIALVVGIAVLGEKSSPVRLGGIALSLAGILLAVLG